MIVTQKLEMNLDRPDTGIRLHAVQGDQYSRAVCFLLRENGMKWQIPGDFRLVVCFARTDGTGGAYESLEDDSPAWETRGNALTVFLAPQMMTLPGDVAVQLGLYSGESVLHSFRFVLEVSPALAEPESAGDFVRWRSAYFPQLTGAEPGQVVQITEVDAQGRVRRAEGITPAQENPEPPLPLQGKTVVCFGDSLFAGCLDETSVTAVLAERTGALVHNVGFVETWMGASDYMELAPFSMWALAEAVCGGDFSWQEELVDQGPEAFRQQLDALKGIDFSAVDAAVIHFGTWDFMNGASLDDGGDDVCSLCGGLRYSINRLLEVYPKLRIYVSLPLFCFPADEAGELHSSDTYENGSGQTLPEFVRAIRGVAEEYHLPVIDGYSCLGINWLNGLFFMPDGIHLNEAGRRRVGEFLGARLTGCAGI